jgi:hypothetical protein
MRSKLGQSKVTKRTIPSAVFMVASMALLTANSAMAMDPVSRGGVVNSDQMLELGTSDSSALRLEGEQSMRINNIDRAITLLQKAIQLAPRDMDGHILYAEALEKKLMKQKDRDPVLYNSVVKEWLYVAKKADFMDQSNQGVRHLAELTGQKPHKWDSSGRYLSRVLLPEENRSAQVAFHGKPGDKPQ